MIQKSEIKKFAKLVTDAFLDGKENIDLQGTTQDHIDAFVIPIMTDVEDTVNAMLASRIKESFEEEPLEPTDEWWTNRR